MGKYLTNRSLFFALTLVLAIVFSFFLMHMTPGDPVDLMLGAQAPEAQKQAYRQLLKLDQPLWTQFVLYIRNIPRGQLGQSMAFNRPVLDLIKARFPYTLQLAVFSILLSTLLGIGIGLISAFLFRFPIMNLFLLAFSVVGQSTPNFLLGPLLMLGLAIMLPIFPVSGFGSFAHLILPSLTLSLCLFAIVSRMTYVGLIHEAKKEYFLVARAKGLSQIQAFMRHALHNVGIPLAHLVGLQLGALLTGAVVTEYIFDWPGIGSLFFSAIEQRDYPLIQGLILVFTASFAIVNFVVDVFNGVLDPRIRHRGYENR